jgi:hypothetical protein
LHADWPRQIDETVAWLQALQPTLLLCNAACLPLAAAARLGLPAFGMSSLNWADLFAHVFDGEAWAVPIHAQLLEAYRAATLFIKLRPGMEMASLPRNVWAAPVASPGRARRTELRRRLGVAAGERIVLVAFGGIDTQLPLQQWRFADALHWLVPGYWECRHARVSAIESLGWPFGDVLASVDALLGKPGYGSFVEAARGGTPVLYVPRPDWPEQEPLRRWLHEHGRALAVDEDALHSGELGPALAALWRQPAKRRPRADGADEVAERLARVLVGAEPLAGAEPLRPSSR